MQGDKKIRFPLGGDLYAYVNTTRRDGVKIHIRHFQLSTNTKGGVKPTAKGVKMDAKTLRRLVAVKKQLTDEFKLHFAKMNEDKKLSEKQKRCREELRLELPEKQKRCRKELPETAPPTPEKEQEIRQLRTWPVHLLEASSQQQPQPQNDNVNNYPAAFVDVGALTPTYSFNAS